MDLEKRIEDLEEELFVYQSDENVKQIKIDDLEKRNKKMEKLLLQREEQEKKGKNNEEFEKVKEQL